MDHIARHLPPWLAWPLNLASTLAAVAGAALAFYGAAFGDAATAPFLWAGAAFAAAAALWLAADLAASNGPPDA